MTVLSKLDDNDPGERRMEFRDDPAYYNCKWKCQLLFYLFMLFFAYLFFKRFILYISFAASV